MPQPSDLFIRPFQLLQSTGNENYHEIGNIKRSIEVEEINVVAKLVCSKEINMYIFWKNMTK